MSFASVKEIAAIHEIVDPWLRIRSYSAARENGGLYPEGPYAFEADGKVDPEALLCAEWGNAQAARNVRAHLLSRTEDALDALAAVGWRLTAAPRMEVTTRLTLRGNAPPLQHDIGLKVWFSVDRQYAEAERAMDPDVMADKLLGPLV